MYSDSDLNSIGVRLVDLETGELSAASVEELLDGLFPLPAEAHSETTVLGSKRAPVRREAALGKSAISDRSRERLVCKVYADMVQIGQVERGDDEGEDARVLSRAGDAAAVRGLVQGFSRRSRSRMMQECARIRDVEHGFFLTLTFPDFVVSAFESVEEMALWAKDAWSVLRKRLAREFPRGGGVWRMELQDRKSGDFKGQLVPHFHVMFFAGEPVPLMMVTDWLCESWCEVVGLHAREFVEHGTNAWGINDRRHAMAYASKYAAKVEGDGVAAGRRWGRFGKLDQSAAVEYELSVDQIVQLKRLQRSWLRSRGGRRYARVLARLPAAYGGYMLGLGDMSVKAGWSGRAPTILQMLSAVGVEVANG